MAEKVAQCMENACKNNNIGYDQLQRNTLLAQARKYNYDVSKVNTPCETDCSALVSVACMYAGVPESVLTLSGNCATTRTLQAVLKATGDVQIFTTPLYTANTTRLKRGDILLKAGHHVVVVVDIGDNPYKLTSSLLKEGSIGESVAWLQYELNRHGANLDVDKQFGVKTKLAVLLFQKDNGLTQDGIVGEETINKLNELKA
ncbi:MAG: peptidoglycan-binding protein [Bacteroidota bacterium]|nr:peptidoglycan-binding protein [Bacteroidota bacterium]